MHSTSKLQERFNAVEVQATCLNDILREARMYSERALPDLLERWGESVANHFILENISPPHNSKNALSEATSLQIEQSIVSFFEAVTAQLNKVPWSIADNGKFYNAGLNALLKVTNALSTRSTKSNTMERVLTAWAPDAMWHSLKITQDKQHSAQEDVVNRWEDLLFWRWTKVLGLQTVVSDWGPAKNSCSDGLWYVTPFCSLPNPDAAVASMAAKMPWSFGAAMDFYRSEDESNITPSMIETIFAMDLSKADAALSTRILLELIFDYTRYGNHMPAMEYFREKNSTLFSSLQLHTVLCKDIMDLDNHISASVDTWTKVVNNIAIEQIPLPDLGFECPQGP